MQEATQPVNLLAQNKALNKQLQSYCQMLFLKLILGNALHLGTLLAYVRQTNVNPKMKYRYFYQ